MRMLLAGALCLLLAGAVCGCGKKEDAPEKVTAPINNSDPRAATAPSATFDESPGALAARMSGKGLKGK